jgi:Leucine-rich repeat (LRR) protein
VNLSEKVKNLDLSLNYLSLLPIKLQWKVTGLNLSENAFGEWPVALTPEQYPKLTYLSLATNPLQTTPPFTTGFPALKHLDLSQTKLVAVPVWLDSCVELRSVRFCGSSFVRDATPGRFSKLPKCRFLDITGLKLPEGEEPVEVGKKCRIFIMKGLSKARIPQRRTSIII